MELICPVIIMSNEDVEHRFGWVVVVVANIVIVAYCCA